MNTIELAYQPFAQVAQSRGSGSMWLLLLIVLVLFAIAIVIAHHKYQESKVLTLSESPSDGG